jgi:putative hydrolase of the HAD superfamily
MRFRIATYVAKVLNISLEEARTTSTEMYKKYGLTGRALAIEHKVDAHDYFEFVHTLDRSVIPRDDRLRSMLLQLAADGHDLWILTNAIHSHARLCLEALGINDLFPEGKVLDCWDQWNATGENRETKPLAGAYAMMAERARIDEANEVVFMIEDSPENLEEPTKRGWRGVLVLDNEVHPPHEPFLFGDVLRNGIYDLPQVVASEIQRRSAKTAIAQ